MQHIEMEMESGSSSLPLLIFYLMGVRWGKVTMDRTRAEIEKLM